MTRWKIPAAVALAAVLCGCASQPARTAETAVTLSPAQHCEVSVLVLLGKSVTAVQQGYPDGISPDDVLAQLGESSPVYEAFMQLDGQVVSSAALHGAAGSTGPAVQAQALQLCQRYGA